MIKLAYYLMVIQLRLHYYYYAKYDETSINYLVIGPKAPYY